MKKIFVVLLALAAVIAPYAQAKTCTGTYCNYIDTNPGFEDTPSHGYRWSYVAGVTFAPTSVCPSNSSYVAQLENTEEIWRFPFIDAAYSSYKLTFDVYLPGDTNNFYDELTISVKNNTTQITETMTLHGSSFDNCQGTVEFPLNNDYDYDNTTVVFSSGTFSNHVWQIDNVSFLAYY
jgi:hypothetical protein